MIDATIVIPTYRHAALLPYSVIPYRLSAG